MNKVPEIESDGPITVTPQESLMILAAHSLDLTKFIEILKQEVPTVIAFIGCDPRIPEDYACIMGMAVVAYFREVGLPESLKPYGENKVSLAFGNFLEKDRHLPVADRVYPFSFEGDWDKMLQAHHDLIMDMETHDYAERGPHNPFDDEDAWQHREDGL